MTIFKRSFRVPEAWSAAVKKNRSVFVAAGSTIGAGSSGGFSGAGGAGSVCGCGLGRYEVSMASAKGFAYGDVSMSDGPGAGWSKNDPSSRDSRKSLDHAKRSGPDTYVTRSVEKRTIEPRIHCPTFLAGTRMRSVVSSSYWARPDLGREPGVVVHQTALLLISRSKVKRTGIVNSEPRGCLPGCTLATSIDGFGTGAD